MPVPTGMVMDLEGLQHLRVVAEALVTVLAAINHGALEVGLGICVLAFEVEYPAYGVKV